MSRWLLLWNFRYFHACWYLEERRVRFELEVFDVAETGKAVVAVADLDAHRCLRSRHHDERERESVLLRFVNGAGNTVGARLRWFDLVRQHVGQLVAK